MRKKEIDTTRNREQSQERGKTVRVPFGAHRLKLQLSEADMKKFEEMCQEAEFYSFIKEMDKWKESFSRGQSLVDLISQLT